MQEPVEMVVEDTTDLGSEAIKNPKSHDGFMMISLLHRFFGKKTMAMYIEWASKIFNNFYVIIADDMDVYNAMVFEDMDKDEALTKMREIGDEKKRSYMRTVNRLAADGVSNVHIVQHRDFFENEKYQEIVSLIRQQAVEDTSFRSSLVKLVLGNVGKKFDDRMKEVNADEETRKTQFATLCEYIYQELAGIIFFTEVGMNGKGIPVEVDPTPEFSTKKELYEGMLSQVQAAFKKMNFFLEQRGHINVHPLGIEKSSY